MDDPIKIRDEEIERLNRHVGGLEGVIENRMCPCAEINALRSRIADLEGVLLEGWGDWSFSGQLGIIAHELEEWVGNKDLAEKLLAKAAAIDAVLPEKEPNDAK